MVYNLKWKLCALAQVHRASRPPRRGPGDPDASRSPATSRVLANAPARARAVTRNTGQVAPDRVGLPCVLAAGGAGPHAGHPGPPPRGEGDTRGPELLLSTTRWPKSGRESRVERSGNFAKSYHGVPPSTTPGACHKEMQTLHGQVGYDSSGGSAGLFAVGFARRGTAQTATTMICGDKITAATTMRGRKGRALIAMPRNSPTIPTRIIRPRIVCGNFMTRLLDSAAECMLRAVWNETSHTNPKRKRGNDLQSSLTLRVSVASGREQYNLQPMRLASRRSAVGFACRMHRCPTRLLEADPSNGLQIKPKPMKSANTYTTGYASPTWIAAPSTMATIATTIISRRVVLEKFMRLTRAATNPSRTGSS